jgi:hypothetical protein
VLDKLSPDQKQEVRHRCRNPKCRLKLKSPTANFRDAFCCAGCHTSYYRHRCLACEREMARNAEHQKVCYRAECKTAWRQKTVISRFLGAGTCSVSTPLETPIKLGPFWPDKTGRPWRIVAGPNSGWNFSAAVVPDGPGGQWQGGEFERIETKSRGALKAVFAKLAKDCRYQRDTPPTNLLGGYKFPGAPTAAELGLVKPKVEQVEPVEPTTVVDRPDLAIGPDLSIPNFLKREFSAVATPQEDGRVLTDPAVSHGRWSKSTC